MSVSRLIDKHVREVMRRHLGQHDYDDLFSEGLCGALHALDMFDPKFDVRFNTYAYHWIKQRVTRWCWNDRLIAVSENQRSSDPDAWLKHRDTERVSNWWGLRTESIIREQDQMIEDPDCSEAVASIVSADVRRNIEALDEPYRTTMDLYYVQGLSTDECLDRMLESGLVKFSTRGRACMVRTEALYEFVRNFKGSAESMSHVLRLSDSLDARFAARIRSPNCPKPSQHLYDLSRWIKMPQSHIADSLIRLAENGDELASEWIRVAWLA